VVDKVDAHTQRSATGLLVEDQHDTALQFVHKQFKTYGDLGIVTERVLEELENRKDDRKLIDVYASLKQLALENGEGSQDRKIQHAIALLKKSTPQTGRYISRIMLGTLRLGFLI
jgi:ATP-dependent DNA ligase